MVRSALNEHISGTHDRLVLVHDGDQFAMQNNRVVDRRSDVHAGRLMAVRMRMRIGKHGGKSGRSLPTALFGVFGLGWDINDPKHRPTLWRRDTLVRLNVIGRIDQRTVTNRTPQVGVAIARPRRNRERCRRLTVLRNVRLAIGIHGSDQTTHRGKNSYHASLSQKNGTVTATNAASGEDPASPVDGSPVPTEDARAVAATAPLPAVVDLTQDRILVAAEELFSRQGVEKTSLRELTAAAGVNVGAVNYYFRSKDGLAEAVFERVSARVNQRRTAELQAHLQIAQRHQHPPQLETIIETFIRPYVDESSGDGALLAQLILQHRLSPSPMTARIIEKHFDPMAKKYIRALSQALPCVPAVEQYWRYTFMVSTVVLTITDRGSDSRLARLSAGSADPTRKEELRRYLLRFLKGGLTAQ